MRIFEWGIFKCVINLNIKYREIKYIMEFIEEKSILVNS